MKTKWIGLGAVVLIAGAIIGFKTHLSPEAEAANVAQPPRVLLVAELSEANNAGDSCAEIIHLVRAARDWGIAVQELDAGSKSGLLTRYHVLIIPTVLMLLSSTGASRHPSAVFQRSSFRARHCRFCGFAWFFGRLYRARSRPGNSAQIRDCCFADSHGSAPAGVDTSAIGNSKIISPGITGAFGTGLMLSLIIGPCGTPILASVLSYAAYEQSAIYSGLLLFAYGIGNGLPLMLAGTASGTFLNRLDSSRFRNWIDPGVGGLLILLGFYLLWRA